MHPTSRSAAQAVLWLTLAVPLFVSIGGLAIDGGVLLSARRELQSVADGAARAGATRIDMAHLRSSGGSEVQLDPRLATSAARTYVDDALIATAHAWQATPDIQIDVGTRRVNLLIRARLPTAFLRIVHIDDVSVEARAFADVQSGIHDGGG
jgi:hypothetical protein